MNIHLKKSAMKKKARSRKGLQALNRGKSFERMVAKDVRGIRVGGKGDNELRKSFDVYTDEYIFECKNYKKRPSPTVIMQWWDKLLGRVEAANEGGPEREPVLCIRIQGEQGYWLLSEGGHGYLGDTLCWYWSKMSNPFMVKHPKRGQRK